MIGSPGHLTGPAEATRENADRHATRGIFFTGHARHCAATLQDYGPVQSVVPPADLLAAACRLPRVAGADPVALGRDGQAGLPGGGLSREADCYRTATNRKSQMSPHGKVAVTEDQLLREFTGEGPSGATQGPRVLGCMRAGGGCSIDFGVRQEPPLLRCCSTRGPGCRCRCPPPSLPAA